MSHTVAPAPQDPYLDRARHKGVNPLFYWLVRAVLQPFFHAWFRVSRLGREHLPAEGGFIIAANHRSFLDPFVIATMARRPIYFVAKRELFEKRWQAWVLNNLGAFPINRGAADADAMGTARAILERGDGVLIFPEGTRVREGALGSPKRGVGRLALETGVPVVPVSILGSEDVRRGWRIRPRKVRIRAGRALTFPRVDAPSPQLATAVTERIWPCVALQWEWLGGTPPVRRAVVLGAGAGGPDVAAALARAGVQVEHGAADLATADLVVLAAAGDALPGLVAAHGAAIPARAGVLVLTRGAVPARAAGELTLPTAYVAENVGARAVACLGGPGPAQVVASADRGFARQVAELLQAAGLATQTTRDVAGVELASAASHVAGLAAATARAAGPGAAGTAAGLVLAELSVLAETPFAGLAGAGDLVAAVLQEGSHAEARRTLALVSAAVAAAGHDAPALRGLADVLDGSGDAAAWTAGITAPARSLRRVA